MVLSSLRCGKISPDSSVINYQYISACKVSHSFCLLLKQWIFSEMYRSKGKISCCSFETEWNEMKEVSSFSNKLL